MKKYITTSLLIISMFVGITCNPGITGNVPEAYAQAATVKSISQCKPKVSIASQDGNTTKLCIDKVQGATEYKVYRANDKNGTYKCVGTTKNGVYKDKAAGNKKCYYKVKACKTSKKAKTLSKYSNVVTTTEPKQNTTTPTTKPTTGSKVPSSTGTVTNNQTTQSYADEVLKLVNQERAKAGLNALTTNATLQNAANKRAQEIVSSFSHTRPDGRSFSTVLADYSISYRAAGENIAYGQKTPSEVMTAWMNSPGHRANILGSQFGKVGIGVYKASDGRYYWSQEFTN